MFSSVPVWVFGTVCLVPVGNPPLRFPTGMTWPVAPDPTGPQAEP